MSYDTYYICQEIRTLNVYEAIQAGELRDSPVYMDVYSGDPVLQGRHVYEDGGVDFCGATATNLSAPCGVYEPEGRADG